MTGFLLFSELYGWDIAKGKSRREVIWVKSREMNFTPEGVAMWQRHSHAKQKALWHKDLECVEYFANAFQSWQSGKGRSLKCRLRHARSP